MKFIEETRNNFVWQLENNEQPQGEGIKIELDQSGNKIARFSNKMYKTLNDCRIDTMDGIQKLTGKQTKPLSHYRSKGLKITDSDWEIMQGLMTNPDFFKKEDFRVYEDHLANNFIDRDVERFRIDALKSFSKTIVNKSLLIGHSWGPPGEGIYYKSKIEKTSIDETLELIGNTRNKKITQHLEQIEELDSGIFWLVPAFYVLTDDMKLVRYMDAGIWKHKSIGFWSPVRVDIKSEEDGETLWREYQNTKDEESEAYEASIVHLGSQLGSQITKSNDGKIIINTPEDLLKIIQISKGVKKMELKINSLDVSYTIEEEKLEETLKTVQEDIEEKVQDKIDEITESIDTLKTINEDLNNDANELKELKKVLGDDISPEMAKNIKEQAEQYKIDLVEEAVKYGALTSLIEKEDVENRKQALQVLDIEEIKRQRDEYRKIHDERNTGTGELVDNQNEPKELRLDPENAYELD